MGMVQFLICKMFLVFHPVVFPELTITLPPEVGENSTEDLMICVNVSVPSVLLIKVPYQFTNGNAIALEGKKHHVRISCGR